MFKACEENFGIKEEEFNKNESKGHFDNPIILLNVQQLKKIRAKKFIHNLISRIPDETN